MKNAIIFGTGSFGEIADLYLRLDGYDVVAFVATADQAAKQLEFRGRPVVDIDTIGQKFDPATTEAFVAVGYRKSNALRRAFCEQIKGAGFRLLSYVSPKATHMPETTIGENVFVFEDNTIQPFTSIGDGVVLWSGNHIGHHSVIEPWCFVTSHVVISGHCRIGQSSFIGVNATIADSMTIGERNLIGPGAIIQKSTGPDEAWFASRAEKFPKPSSFFLR